MARKIIVLEVPDGETGDQVLHCAFWLPVPAANQSFFAIQTTQQTLLTRFKGASAAELTDLQNGVVREEIVQFQVPAGWTPAQIKSELISRYNARAATFTAELNKLRFYGLSWDGATWS